MSGQKSREERWHLPKTSKYGVLTKWRAWSAQSGARKTPVIHHQWRKKHLLLFSCRLAYRTPPKLVSCPQQVFSNLLRKARGIPIQQWHGVWGKWQSRRLESRINNTDTSDYKQKWVPLNGSEMNLKRKQFRKVHFLKWIKYLNSHFTKKGYLMVNKFMKRCPTSLVIRER